MNSFNLRPCYIALTLALFVVIGVSCKQEEPPPAAPSSKADRASGSKDTDDTKALNEFLNKDKPAAPSNAALPPNHPPIGGTAPSNPSATGASLPPGHPPLPGKESKQTDSITYQAPTDWKPQPVTSSMRKAQFLIPRATGDSNDGQMVVFYFGQGQGGSVESNIDRWTGMFTTVDGKPLPIDSIKRVSHEVDGMKITTLDVSGHYVDTMSGMKSTSANDEWRMLSAIVESPQGPWFFKGVGPIATMKAQEGSFKKFVESIKKN